MFNTFLKGLFLHYGLEKYYKDALSVYFKKSHVVELKMNNVAS